MNKKIKNVDDIRAVLLEEISLIRKGKSTNGRSNAISRSVSQVLSTIRLEMAYAKMLGMNPKIPMVSLQQPKEKISAEIRSKKTT